MAKFFYGSQSTTTKEIWDTLVVTHEGNAEVKRSRLNTLYQEYELFIIQHRESILNLQKIFVHLIALGKNFTKVELFLKVLRSLIKECHSKVTTISEKKSLSTMSSTLLFRKLQEHEIELRRLEKYEIQEKKSQGIALKVDSRE